MTCNTLTPLAHPPLLDSFIYSFSSVLYNGLLLNMQHTYTHTSLAHPPLLASLLHLCTVHRAAARHAVVDPPKEARRQSHSHAPHLFSTGQGENPLPTNDLVVFHKRLCCVKPGVPQTAVLCPTNDCVVS
jgi:hypothetical protein